MDTLCIVILSPYKIEQGFVLPCTVEVNTVAVPLYFVIFYPQTIFVLDFSYFSVDQNINLHYIHHTEFVAVLSVYMNPDSAHDLF